MNNFIIISRTYCEWTPESSEDGDFSDTGFISEKEEVSFRELVYLMKEHIHPSQSPNPYNTHVWYSCEPYTRDFGTCTAREESIHFHRDNTPNAEKYWKWAAQFAENKIK